MIVGVRIEGYMNHRFLGAGCRGHPPLEILVGLMDIYRAAAVVVNLVGIEQPPFLLVYLFRIVGQSAVNGIS